MKYLALDAINNHHQEFETIEEARAYIIESSTDCDGMYNPDCVRSKIYTIIETVGYDVVDSKADYKYLDEEDIPESDDEAEAWPYDNNVDEIWDIKFIPAEVRLTF